MLGNVMPLTLLIGGRLTPPSGTEEDEEVLDGGIAGMKCLGKHLHGELSMETTFIVLFIDHNDMLWKYIYIKNYI